MLVYLNEDTFCDNDDMLHVSVKHVMDRNIKIVLVHERNMQMGGCPFDEIITQTPQELINDPYNIFSQDIAISLYSETEYEHVSICQILRKLGAEPDTSKSKLTFPTFFLSNKK